MKLEEYNKLEEKKEFFQFGDSQYDHNTDEIFKSTLINFIFNPSEISFIKKGTYNLVSVKKTNDSDFYLKAKTDHKSIDLNASYLLLINFKSTKIKNAFWGSLNQDTYYGIENYSYDLGKNKKEVGNGFEADLNGIWLKNSKNIDELSCSKKKEYHVHHKCYRKNVEIWDQANYEYVTLCNTCHKIVHESFRIPFYDENGQILGDLKICDRCYGKKFFWEFSNVNDGRCFKCHGTGYEN